MRIIEKILNKCGYVKGASNSIYKEYSPIRISGKTIPLINFFSDRKEKLDWDGREKEIIIKSMIPQIEKMIIWMENEYVMSGEIYVMPKAYYEHIGRKAVNEIARLNLCGTTK